MLVEKRLDTSNSARAFVLNTRTMEHMRQIGLEKKFQDASYPRDQKVYFCVCTSVLNGKIIYDRTMMSWGDLADGKEGMSFPAFNRDHSVSPSTLCPQFAQEVVLKDSLDSKPEASIMWGWEAIALSQDEEGVTLKAKSASGQEKVLRAKYALGCDGGKSWVRKYLGIHTYGKFVVQRACSITFKSLEFMARLKEEKRFGAFFLMSQVAGVMIALNNEGMFAFHCICPPNTTDEQLEERCHNAASYVRAGIGSSDIPVTIMDASPYNMHALISTKYRCGRVLLVGDSAHQWLPVGGLGLNTGIGDAANLGWKLAGVLKGWAGEHLLDSYSLERTPVADTCRRLALTPVGTLLFDAPGAIAFLANFPGIRFLLNSVSDRMLSMQLENAVEVILGYRYSHSNAICYETDPFTNTGSVFSSLTGQRAPHVALSESPSILDLFGKCFVLLVIGGGETDCEHIQEGMRQRGVPFKVRAFPCFPELLQRYNRKYYLVRPDGVVCWRADYQPSAFEVDQNIIPVMCGDVLPLPPPPKQAPQPPAPNFSFLADVGVGVSMAMVLCTRNHCNMSLRHVLVYGLAAATFLSHFRGSRRRSSPPFMQQVSRHSAWLTTEFGHAANALKLERRFVSSFGPKDVLIRVHAASINPIDTLVRQGYMASLLQYQAYMTGRSSIFPYVLGRDCSGEVVAVGDDVCAFFPGDEVYAAVSLTLNGTHAEYVCVREEDVSPKPRNVDHREAASLPWVAVTVWTALVEHAGLTPHNTRGKRVLVHGGSGGVGSFAIQLLKAWGAHVTTTCSTNNITFVHSLGADVAIDYTSGHLSTALTKYSFDAVLDPIGSYESASLSLLKLYDGAHYVSLKSPQGFFTACLGSLLGGFVHQWFYRYKIFSNRIFGGRGFHYSIAQPSGAALRAVKDLVESGAVKPILEAVYPMEEMVAAHLHVEGGHTRGKVVVSMIEE